MTQYTDVMVDLETVGTAPGSGIISIGAVAFAPGMAEDGWKAFQSPPISRASCRAVGLTEDRATLDWWARQDRAAKDVFDHATDGVSCGLVHALTEFTGFFPSGAWLWGNGANFDNVLLRCAYVAVDLSVPWKYWDDRCYRTMKNEFAAIPVSAFQGVKHTALADALHQARHLQAIWAYKKRMEAAGLLQAVRGGALSAPLPSA